MKYRRQEKYVLTEDCGVQTPFRLHEVAYWPNKTYWKIRLNPNGWMLVVAGYVSDGPSGPTKDQPWNMRAAMAVHDPLYDLGGAGMLPPDGKKIADNLFHQEMKIDIAAIYEAEMEKAEQMSFIRRALRKTGIRTTRRARLIRARYYKFGVRKWGFSAYRSPEEAPVILSAPL